MYRCIEPQSSRFGSEAFILFRNSPTSLSHLFNFHNFKMWTTANTYWVNLLAFRVECKLYSGTASSGAEKKRSASQTEMNKGSVAPDFVCFFDLFFSKKIDCFQSFRVCIFLYSSSWVSIVYKRFTGKRSDVTVFIYDRFTQYQYPVPSYVWFSCGPNKVLQAPCFILTGGFFEINVLFWCRELRQLNSANKVTFNSIPRKSRNNWNARSDKEIHTTFTVNFALACFPLPLPHTFLLFFPTFKPHFTRSCHFLRWKRIPPEQIITGTSPHVNPKDCSVTDCTAGTKDMAPLGGATSKRARQAKNTWHL